MGGKKGQKSGGNGRERRAAKKAIGVKAAQGQPQAEAQTVESGGVAGTADAVAQTGELVDFKTATRKPRTHRAPSASAEPKVGKDGMAKLPPLPRANRKRKPKPYVKCACGCGLDTRSKWAPGHDARHKGWLARIKAGVVTIDSELITDGERAVLKAAIAATGAGQPEAANG